MIVRVFHGTVRPGTEDDYARFLALDALPRFHGRLGLRSLHVRFPVPDDRAPEFVVTSVWGDRSALEAFAGTRWREANIMSEEERRLLVDARTAHHEDPAGAEEVDLARTLLPSLPLPAEPFQLLVVPGGMVQPTAVTASLRLCGLRPIVGSPAEAMRLLGRWRPQAAILDASTPSGAAIAERSPGCRSRSSSWGKTTGSTGAFRD